MTNISYPLLRQSLLAMAKTDQKLRTEVIHEGKPWDDSIDIENAAQLKQIITEYGWPTIPKVGVEASNDAWLIAQHADHDRLFQRRCLTILKKVPKNEISLHNIAYLEDRILVAESKPQLYGTQFRGKGIALEPQPIKDPSHVDERRKNMGLGTLAEYQKTMLEMYGSD